MWWAFSTLTTVGYGDVTPITNGGKMFGSLITVIGMGMVALPTGIIASGYAHQMRMRSERYQILDKAVVEMALKGKAMGSYCSHCGSALGKDQT